MKKLVSPKYILSFKVIQKNNIYLNKNTKKNIHIKSNFLQKLFYKTENIKMKPKIIFDRYISRKNFYQSISEVDPKVNKFINNYMKVNSYNNCKTNSLPPFIIKDLNLIYPNAISIKYRICTKS